MFKTQIKSILSKKTIYKIIQIREAIKFYLIKISINNDLFIYLSIIFDKNYISEQRAILNGSYIYEKEKRKKESNIYNLRRNIHRIEKGLLMKPLRKEFALGFIENTVQNYVNINHEKYKDISLWGYDILNEYFKNTDSKNEKYINSKKIYFENLKPFNNNNYIPYSVKESSNIAYNDFKKMMLLRKSTRWFISKKIEDEDILKALDIARLSPSGCNRQPYRYIITTNSERAQNIASISGGTGGWSHNIPAIAVLIGRQRSFTGTINRHSVYIDSTLTIMPFCLSLETIGLSSCIINWVDIPERLNKITKELKLEKDECVIASIAIGYPDYNEKVAYSKRMPTNNLVNFI